MQPIANPQPMYIPTRISPDVVASSRQLIPLGTVEMGGKSYYKFDTGCEWYKAVAYYPVSVIRSINQMAENEVIEIASGDTTRINMTIKPAKVVAEPEQIPAPVVEPEVESEPGAKIVSWYAESPYERRRAEKEIAELEATGWTFRSMAAVGIDSDSQVGEYSVLYVRPQAAVKS